MRTSRGASNLVQDPAASTAVLVVDVAGLRCGLHVDTVVELHRMVASVPVPDAPTVIDGVIDVRGEVVVVLDLRTRFGLPGRPPRPSDHLVLVRTQGRSIALRVDRVLDLVTVPLGAFDAGIGSPPGTQLRGVARLADGLVLITDVDAFLSADEAADLDEALAELTAAAGTAPGRGGDQS